MCPMYYPALFIPFVLALKLDSVARTNRFDSRGKIDVVCNQQCLTGRQSNDEFLVPAALGIVSQQFDDDAFTGNLQIAFMVEECI